MITTSAITTIASPTTTTTPATTTITNSLHTSSCGVPDAQFPIKSKAETNQRIWGGAEVRPHSLPWQVMIVMHGDGPGGKRLVDYLDSY